MKKRVLSIALCLCMLLTLLPAAALAADGDTAGGITIEGSDTVYATLAEAAAAAQNDETILIPEGEYDIGTLNLSTNVNLQGAGSGKTVLKGTIAQGQSYGDTTFSGFTMVSTGSHVALNIAGAFNADSGKLAEAAITVEDCIFQGYEYTIGMNSYVEDSELVIRDCQFVSCGCAAAVQTGAGNTVTYENTTMDGGFATQSFGSDYNDFYYAMDADLTAEPDLDAVAHPVTFITPVSDVASKLSSAADNGLVVFTSGVFDVGNAKLNKAASIQGAGADNTTLLGSLNYYCGNDAETIKVSDLTIQAPANNTTAQQAIWWSYNTANPLDGAKLVVEDCTVVDYLFAIGVNSSTRNCELTATGLTLDNVWCGANVSEGAGNVIADFQVADGSTVVYEVQVFDLTAAEESEKYNGYYDTYASCQADADRTAPTADGADVEMPSLGDPTGPNWPAVAQIDGVYYGSLQAAVDAATADDVITLLDDVTLTEAVTLSQGDAITIDGNGKTITFPTASGMRAAFYVPSSVDGASLSVSNVVFESSGGNLDSEGKPLSGYAILVGEATNNVSVSANQCSFSDLWCGVYFGHVMPGQSGSVSITNSTYDNVKYGYSIDEVTGGSAVGAVTPEFTGNTGVETVSETWANITLTHEETTTAYTSLAAAIADAADGDTITLNKDVAESVTIDKAITINGNGHKIAPASGTAVNVTVGGVVLNNVCAAGSGSNGYGLTVGAQDGPVAGDITVSGGSYTTTDANLQGAGAMRIFADGKVVVKDTTTVGGIHVFNPASYEITGNIVGFTYTGETPFVGILVYYDTLPEAMDAEAGADALMAGNLVSVPNTASDFVQIAENWVNKGEVPAADNVVAQIGSNLYASLQTAVDVVPNNGTITLLTDCAERVTVSRVVTFTIAKAADVEFTGSISAGSGYRVYEENGTYTVEVYTPSGGGGGTVTKPEEDKLPFSDVEGHWALEAIEYVYEKGMMNGTTSTKFSPDAELTRGMIVTILYRLEGEPSVSGSTFTDVKASMYYADPVAWAAKNGIVTGYGDGTFGPEDSITREQLAAILYRYASYKGYDVTISADLSSYTDADSVSAYAVDAMSWANAEGLITGVTATTLNPTGTATRAQVATILMRFVENVAK